MRKILDISLRGLSQNCVIWPERPKPAKLHYVRWQRERRNYERGAREIIQTGIAYIRRQLVGKSSDELVKFQRNAKGDAGPGTGGVAVMVEGIIKRTSVQ